MSEFYAPRLYAADIIRLPTRQRRIEALDGVPKHLRSTVEYYVTHWWSKRHLMRPPGSYESSEVVR